MKLTRTAAKKRTLRQLADLNDQYCYLSLVDARFFPQIAEAAIANPELYTTDLYPEELAAERLHVRVGQIAQFRHDTGDIARAAFFSTSYEAVRQYLLDACHDLGADSLPQGVAVEKHLVERFASLGHLLDNCLHHLLAYLRLRRNQVAHRLPRGNEELRALVKYHGPELNERWATEGSVDFSAVPSLRLPDEECVGLLKLLRETVEEVDAVAAKALDPIPILESLRADFLSRNPGLGSADNRARLASKIRRAGLQLYGLLEDSDGEVASWLDDGEGGA